MIYFWKKDRQRRGVPSVRRRECRAPAAIARTLAFGGSVKGTDTLGDKASLTRSKRIQKIGT